MVQIVKYIDFTVDSNRVFCSTILLMSNNCTIFIKVHVYG